MAVGDRIQIGESQFLVEQLGSFENAEDLPQETSPQQRPKTTIRLNREQLSQAAGEAEDSSMNVLEERIQQISQQAESVGVKFDHFDSRMEQLTQTLTSLASAIHQTEAQDLESPEQPCPTANESTESTQEFAREEAPCSESEQVTAASEPNGADLSRLHKSSDSPEKRLKSISEISKQIHFELLNHDEVDRLDLTNQLEAQAAATFGSIPDTPSLEPSTLETVASPSPLQVTELSASTTDDSMPEVAAVAPILDDSSNETKLVHDLDQPAEQSTQNENVVPTSATEFSPSLSSASSETEVPASETEPVANETLVESIRELDAPSPIAEETIGDIRNEPYQIPDQTELPSSSMDGAGFGEPVNKAEPSLDLDSIVNSIDRAEAPQVETNGGETLEEHDNTKSDR